MAEASSAMVWMTVDLQLRMRDIDGIFDYKNAEVQFSTIEGLWQGWGGAGLTFH